MVLTDFGMSQKVDEKNEKNNCLNYILGTLEYIDPLFVQEIDDKYHYGYHNDIFALG